MTRESAHYEHARRSVESLIPYIRNARTHSDATVALIASSIREFGFTNPVLIDEASNVIAGHGRILAARKLGMVDVPCIVVTGLSDAQRRALVLADNQIATTSGWDADLLKIELTDLKADGFELDLIGFSLDTLSDLLAEDAEEDGDASGPASGGAGSLADKFGVPPFTILNAREGWWQNRKRAWLAIGIQSELGRGAAPGGAPMPMDRAKGGGQRRAGRIDDASL